MSSVKLWRGGCSIGIVDVDFVGLVRLRGRRVKVLWGLSCSGEEVYL